MAAKRDARVTNRGLTVGGIAVMTAGLLGLGGTPAHGQTADEVGVRRTAEAVLAAISAGDSAKLRVLLWPGAPVVSLREDADSTITVRRTAEEVIRGIGGSGGRLLERMWSPEVRVSGDIATVWTPYDFHVDREFSHCGIDTFQMARTPEGWKVVAILYTVVRAREHCPPSPLGPPRW